VIVVKELQVVGRFVVELGQEGYSTEGISIGIGHVNGQAIEG